MVRDCGAGGGGEDGSREKGGGGGGGEWDYVEADGCGLCGLSGRRQCGVGFGWWRGCSGHSGVQCAGTIHCGFRWGMSAGDKNKQDLVNANEDHGRVFTERTVC